MGQDLADVNLADAPDVLTVPEVAAVLRIGQRQAYALVRSGQIYGVQVGRAIRVPRVALDRFLAGEDAERPPLAVVRAERPA